MNYFRPCLISAAVSIALATSAVDASTKLPDAGNLQSLKSISKTVGSKSYDAAFQKSLASRTTKSGMKSQFDSSLGKATFLWASEELSKPNLSDIAPENRAAHAANYYLSNLTGVSTRTELASTAVMSYMHDVKNGPLIAKYKQEVHGIEVFNREYNIMMNREYDLVASSGYFSQSPAQHTLNVLANFGDPTTAIKSAFKDLTNGAAEISLTNEKLSSKYYVYNGKSSTDAKTIVAEPRAKKVLFDAEDGLRTAYYVEVAYAEANSVDGEHYSYVIDAISGKILFKHNLVAKEGEFNYRAYANPETGYPMEGPHGDVIPQLTQGTDPTTILDAPMVTLSHYQSLSTSDPWLPEDATTTSGNNGFAYADVIAPQGFSEGDFTAETTAPNTFDYALRPDERANSFNNRKAAIVNLFYMNNFLHDYYYDFGFDEASGNAQLSNYGRGGVEGDPLHLEAQDFSGLNNANMATPADGASPRMQQYLWNSKDAEVGVDFGVTVTDPAAVGLLSSSQVASFGPSQYSDVVGGVVRLEDGTGTGTDGCEAATNAADLAGNIAIIDRGGCAFTVKVTNAQDAGAIAALVVNNVDDGTPAPMGGIDANVTIPSMGLSFADGASIYTHLDAATSVSVEMFSNFPLKDSTFDNGIIAHEYGHYISNRLIGNASGLSNFQGSAMGEGWGDFHGLLFITQASDIEIAGNEEFGVSYATGTFVEDFFQGIRRAPYSTDMNVNPLTFQHITSGAVPPGLPPTSVASPHAPGEIWASALWEVYVSLINTHGFDEAKSRMSSYVVEGYKMTPIAPTYTEARDAILAAAYARDTGDFELALAGFAKRGLGLGAVSPARFSTDLSGVVESNLTELATYSASEFAVNPTYDGVALGYCSNDGILDVGETGTFNVTVKNSGSETLTGVVAQVEVVSAHDVTLENDGLITFDELLPTKEMTSAPLHITLNDAAAADTLELRVTFPELAANDDIVEALPVDLSMLVNLDFQKADPVASESTDDMETFALFDNWQENVMVGGEQAEGTRVRDTVNTAFFQGMSPGVNLGAQTMLIRNNGFESDVAYETSSFEVGFGGDFVVNFWHAYLLEQDYDGGVIEISINDGSWVDVTEVGGTFTNGYVGPLMDNPTQVLQGRDTFHGRNFGIEESINFGTSLNGNQVKLRFRVGSDGFFADFGWFIDNVNITNVTTPVFSEVVAGNTFACDNALPRLSVPGEVTISEDATGSITATVTDRNAGDNLTYTWTQTTGLANPATLSGADTATVTITPPSTDVDLELEFQVTVSDGTAEVSESVTVKINAIVPAPEPEPSSSGSGSMGWLAMLLLPVTFWRRRKHKNK